MVVLQKSRFVVNAFQLFGVYHIKGVAGTVVNAKLVGILRGADFGAGGQIAGVARFGDVIGYIGAFWLGAFGIAESDETQVGTGLYATEEFGAVVDFTGPFDLQGLVLAIADVPLAFAPAQHLK